MKLKQIVLAGAIAILGWLGLSQSVKFAQAYTNQQQALSQITALLREVGDPNQAANLEALKQSQKRLQGTVTALETIPPFPGFKSDRAKAELAKLRPLLDVVNARIGREEQAIADLTAALKLDTQAAESVKNSPHPVEVWQQARSQWQQAISLLEKIPTTSFVFAQAKAGIEACRINFKIADVQWIAELRALKDVDFAIASTEQAAKAIQTRPYQLTDLVRARTQWQRSLEQLNKIAETTTVYRDAQLLASSYQTNIRKLDDAITRIKSCQSRYQITVLDSTSSSLCGDEVSLDLETSKDVLAAQVEPEASDAEPVDDTDVTIAPVPITSTTSYSRYRHLKSSGGGTWVRGYTRSDGTSVRGHYRSSGRASGFGSFRSGGASS